MNEGIKQFFAPLAETGGIGLISHLSPLPPPPGYGMAGTSHSQTPLTYYSEISYSGWPSSEPCVVISESSARAIVAAIDNNRPHKAALIIKGQPWFAEVLAGVRATRHLNPVNYIKLSQRPREMSSSTSH